MRLSIDIIVKPGTDVDEYIRKAGTIFPFVTCEEQIEIDEILRTEFAEGVHIIYG